MVAGGDQGQKGGCSEVSQFQSVTRLQFCTRMQGLYLYGPCSTFATGADQYSVGSYYSCTAVLDLVQLYGTGMSIVCTVWCTMYSCMATDGWSHDQCMVEGDSDSAQYY